MVVDVWLMSREGTCLGIEFDHFGLEKGNGWLTLVSN